jgi:hypothetical protein
MQKYESILLNSDNLSYHHEVYPSHLNRASGNKGGALGCFLLRNVSTLLLFVIGASPVLATWDIRSRKRPPWAFTTLRFLTVRWSSAIEGAGESFSFTRENRCVWAADHEDRPAKVAEEGGKRPLAA